MDSGRNRVDWCLIDYLALRACKSVTLQHLSSRSREDAVKFDTQEAIIERGSSIPTRTQDDLLQAISLMEEALVILDSVDAHLPGVRLQAAIDRARKEITSRSD